MTKKQTLIATLMLLAGATLATAEPFSDVPQSQWAYDAINQLVQKGIIQGFPDGTFRGNLNPSRYHLALMLSRMLASIEKCGINSVSKEDLNTLEKLCTEFADELSHIGVKVTSLENDMLKVKEDVNDIRKDVDSIKEGIKLGNLDNVRLSGDILIRNYGLVHDRGSLDNNDFGENRRHRTETALRLQIDADIDENVSARARWNIIGNENNNRNNPPGLNTNEWYGGNKNTAEVEIAYLKIKDLFSFGGDFKFGRDWFQHGHGFVIHNYMDAVNYTKRVGDVDLALNVFFDRNNNHNAGEDTYNVWNVNADYNYKGHNLYLGVYYTADENVAPTYNENNNDTKNDKSIRVEVGSKGKLLNNDDRFTYDLGAVVSKIEDGNPVDDNGNGPTDAEGILGHVALKYDHDKQLSAKLSYTYANDESNANINVENFNDYCMGDQTIFEDLYLAGMANNDNTNWPFQNLRDYKLEIGYTLRNDDRHHFRLAYDYLENVYQFKDNNFNRIFEPIVTQAMGDPNQRRYYVEDVKANILTFSYTYRLSKDTRLKLCYQNMKVEAKDVPDQCVDLYFTELYSRF